MDAKHRQILEDLANLIESDAAPQSIAFGGGAAKYTVEAIRAALAESYSSLVESARAGLPFIAYAFAQGMAGAEEAGRAIEAAIASKKAVS